MVENHSSPPAQIGMLKLAATVLGGLAVLYGLANFIFEDLPGGPVTASALVLAGAFMLEMGIRLVAGVKSRDIFNIEILAVAALIIGGTVIDQSWIVLVALVAPVILAVLANTGESREWFEERR